MTRKSQISRAELLYWIAECNNNDAILEQTVDLLGFNCPLQRRHLLKESVTVNIEPQPDLPETDEKPLPEVDPSIPKVSFYYLAQRERYASEEEAKQETPPLLDQVESIANNELDHYWQVHPPLPPLVPIPLVNEKRLSPFLRTELQRVVSKRLDIKKLIKRIAYQQPLVEIPTQPHLLPAGRVTVIADLNARLLPFWGDMDALCTLIKQKHGKIGFDGRVLVKDEPRNDYYQYDDWCKQQLTRQQWQKIPAQSVVVIISDLGQLAAKQSLIYQRWLSFVQRLNRRGIQPIVFAPIAAEKQCPQLQSLTQQILWQATGHFRPTTQRGNTVKHQQKLERIIAFLSLSPHIEPVLLRALCQLLPVTEGHSGVEADIYLHNDMQWGYTSINLDPERREHYQALFKEEEAAIQQQVFNTIQQHHSGQFPSVWAETILNAESLMPIEPELVEKAEQLMLRFTKRYYIDRQHKGLQQFAKRHLNRLKAEQHKNKAYVSALYGLAYRQRLLADEEIPAIYDKQVINQLLKQGSEVKSYQLRQRGERLFITLDSYQQKKQHLKVEYGQCLAQFNTVQSTIMVNQRVYSLPLSSDKALEIASLQTEKQQVIQIDTGQERLHIKTLQKPDWADEIGFNEQGLYVVYQQHIVPYPSWAEYVDVDDIGLFSDMCFKGVTQRFRAILSGTFMMGSPKDEVGRYDREDYHQVTLSKGYWRTDTACTQELWQTVMGDNPADFDDDLQNPVESISWLDIQDFLQKLNQYLPHLQAQLPSEAQWEYACRAGTTTPFSFGENITPEQVNYNGNNPYAEGEKGEYRGKTVSVKELPANQWGLYQMHGNIWEWCADEYQDRLGTSPVFDPVNTGVNSDNADKSVDRVLRGGSWFDNGGYCRSAIRYGISADNRLRSDGFRLALGHELQTGQAGTVSGNDKSDQTSVQPEHHPARRGAGQGDDQAGSGLMGRIKNIAKKLIDKK